MGVDKSYGSGKPLSAAQSAARRTAAAKAAGRKKTIKRQAANPGVRLGVSRVGKTENAGFNIGGRKYLETGVSPAKILQAARALVTAGKAAEAAPLFARVAAKVGGQIAKKASVKGNAGRGPFSMKNAFREQSAVKTLTGRDLTSQGARAASESVYPKLPNMGYVPGATRTFDRYADPLSEGAGRIWPGIARKLPKPKLPKNRGGR